MITRRLLQFSLLLFFVSCTAEKDHAEELANLRTFNLEEIPNIELEEDKSFRGSQNAGVNSIGDVTVDEAGNVYFVDNFKRRIQVVDAEGNPTGTIGKAGGKPGEFIKLRNIMVMNGKLYTYDEQLESAYRFNTENNSLEQLTPFSGSGIGVDSLKTASTYSVEIIPDGNFLVAFQVVTSPEQRRLFYYKVNAEGEIVSEQLMAFPNKSLYVREGQEGITILMMPWERETLLQTDAEGKLYALYTEEFLIKVFDREGEYQEAWHYPISKVKLAEADAVDMYTDTITRRAIRGASKPQTWPAVAEWMMDDKNQIWVATITSDLEIYRWYVLSPSGEVLGTLLLPKEKAVKAIAGGYLYTTSFNKRRYVDEIVRFSFQLE